MELLGPRPPCFPVVYSYLHTLWERKYLFLLANFFALNAPAWASQSELRDLKGPEAPCFLWHLVDVSGVGSVTGSNSPGWELVPSCLLLWRPLCVQEVRGEKSHLHKCNWLAILFPSSWASCLLRLCLAPTCRNPLYWPSCIQKHPQIQD